MLIFSTLPVAGFGMLGLIVLCLVVPVFYQLVQILRSLEDHSIHEVQNYIAFGDQVMCWFLISSDFIDTNRSEYSVSNTTVNSDLRMRMIDKSG